MSDAVIPVVVYASIVMFLGVVGNSVVCYICRCRLNQNVLNSFVLSLAVLDLIGCILCVPLEVTEIMTRLRLSEPLLCICQRFLRQILIITSLFILTAIATERYRRICRPLSRHITLRQCRIAVVVAVFIAVLLSWPTLFIFGSRTVTTKHTRWDGSSYKDSTVSPENETLVGRDCAVKDGMHGSVYPVIYFTILFVLFFASCGLLCVLYALIAFRIWRGQKLKTDARAKSASLPDCSRFNATVRADANGPIQATFFEELTRSLQIRRKRDNVSSVLMLPTPSFRRKKRAAYSRKRTTFIMFLMTLTSIFSYLPYVILSIVYVAVPRLQYSEKSDAQTFFLELCLKSFLISSAVNPFIYGFCNQKFKKECTKLVQGFKCTWENRSEEDTSETPPYS